MVGKLGVACYFRGSLIGGRSIFRCKARLELILASSSTIHLPFVDEANTASLNAPSVPSNTIVIQGVTAPGIIIESNSLEEETTALVQRLQEIARRQRELKHAATAHNTVAVTRNTDEERATRRLKRNVVAALSEEQSLNDQLIIIDALSVVGNVPSGSSAETKYDYLALQLSVVEAIPSVGVQKALKALHSKSIQ